MSFTMLALIDCDSFYCSCERIFNLKARKAPVVVLSNNDGCVVSRSKEAKKLGIPMGVPFFKIKHLIREKGLMAFSSNYALYGDISKRVMHTLSTFTPELEVYSIDEAFLNLKNLPIKNHTKLGEEIKNKIYKDVGIPVSIGIAKTKVLAKVAATLAKKGGGVFIIDENKDAILKTFPVENIWGIGRASAIKLQALQIETAYDLMTSDEKLIEKNLSVNGKKILLELRGENTIELMIEPDKRQQILSSKSFEKTLTNKDLIKEYLANHALRVTQKLRKENLLAYGIGIFIHTHHLNEETPYHCSDSIILTKGTNQYAEVLAHSFRIFERVFRNGFEYKKCGVFLFDLRLEQEEQLNLFDQPDLGQDKKIDNISNTIDIINERFGPQAITFLACGKISPWQIGAYRKSPSYTTKWSEIIKVG